MRDERLIADLTVVAVADGPHNVGWTHADEVNSAVPRSSGVKRGTEPAGGRQLAKCELADAGGSRPELARPHRAMRVIGAKPPARRLVVTPGVPRFE